MRFIFKIRIIHGCGKEVHFAQLRTRRDFAMANDIDRQSTFGGQYCLLLKYVNFACDTRNTKSDKM